jgi:hypothetical protein
MDDQLKTEIGVVNGDPTLSELDVENSLIPNIEVGLSVPKGTIWNLISPNSVNPGHKHSNSSAVVTLTDATTITTDASLGNIFDVTITADRTLGNPTNMTDGHKAIWRVKASGADRTLTLDTNFRFGTTVSALTAIASGKTDYIGCIYHGTDAKWDVVAYSKGL